MITQEHVNALPGRTVYDRHGDKIGTVGQIWTEGPGGRPAWASVRTGPFGMNESLLPLQEATWQNDRLLVPYDKSHVTDAPNIDADADEPLSPEDVDLLYEHYHLSHTGYRAGVSHTEAAYAIDDETTSGQGGFGDDAMTRSEERLNVETRAEEASRARLRRYVVTEDAPATVPVRREEARLEREPVTDETTGSDERRRERTEADLPDQDRRRLG